MADVRAWAVVPALLLALVTARASAQQPAPEQPGQRMRVTLRPDTPLPAGLHVDREVELRWQARSEDRLRIEGTFAGQDTDSLWLDPEGAAPPFALPWSHVAALERHAGRRRHTGTFALIVGVPAAGIGALFGGALCSGDYYCERGPTRNALLWGAIVGAGGAALGALIGTAITSDRWVGIETPLVVEPTVIEGRIGASITLRF